MTSNSHSTFNDLLMNVPLMSISIFLGKNPDFNQSFDTGNQRYSELAVVQNFFSDSN